VVLIACALAAGADARSGCELATESVVLQPGDMIRVAIWREEDLSGEFPVDVDGTVTFPLLGERSVAGMPFAEFRGGPH
jgi:protein involved in polysaccharide export with SLBB domain